MSCRATGVVSKEPTPEGAFAAGDVIPSAPGADGDISAASQGTGPAAKPIWEVITADRIVSTLEVDLSRLKVALPTVEFLGTRIENLRIGGFAIDVSVDAALRS